MSDDDLSEFGSPRPPRREDIVFPRRTSEEQQAYVDMAHAADLVDWVYSSGFRLAARALAERASDSKTEHASLVYPILYLYRHHIELALKAIIKSALGLLDLDLSGADLETLNCHDLWRLWQTTRPLINLVCDAAGSSQFPVEELEGVDSYFRQFDELDPDGQRFRYGSMNSSRAKRSGASVSSLPADLKLDIDLITACTERLADYIDSIEWWFVELEDAKVEARRIQGECAD